MSHRKDETKLLTRRSLIKGLGMAPMLLRPAPFHGLGFLPSPGELPPHPAAAFPYSDYRLTPHYPAQSPLEDVLRLVAPGSDDYITEKYAFEITALLAHWGRDLKTSPHNLTALAGLLDPSLQASTLATVPATDTRPPQGPVSTTRHRFVPNIVPGPDRFLKAIQTWLAPLQTIHTAEFEIISIDQVTADPIQVRLGIRYTLAATRTGQPVVREERVGTWQTEWTQPQPGAWKAHRWEADSEITGSIQGPGFIDITQHALGAIPSYRDQVLHGSDYWRTTLDGACGIDVYGNNGITAADYDNDGFDDLYISQPAGLPNRLYRNRGDGTFEDVTEKAGVGVLDNTACALFADLRNNGLQDLIVVCGSGPLLFLNQGDGTFKRKADAFQFAQAPQGTFTHAALADYDGDGRLDIYFCLYSYYLGLDQYHYPVPYYDARNGPPNFLLHNEGDGTFTDRTEASGLNAENDRYSFACAWGHSTSKPGAPDIYVANDFGRNNLYRNNGNGTFTAVSVESHVQDVGAGMSAAWSDTDNDGRQDIYVANMWSAAGQRVAGQQQFHQQSTPDIRALYQRHARGNALYRNQGDGHFSNVSQSAGVELGRWAWGSDFLDFDQDGYQDIYVTNGYISAPSSTAAQPDLGSFFWRQVVARSPDDATPTLSYEHGWQALNELIRSDNSWSGHERNVLFANNRDGTFTEVSGPSGLDFLEDSRSFALADIDHDGRLEIILKNRNSPQIRILHNAMPEIGHSISFRLRGTKSNRDGIGAAITVEAGTVRQTRYLQAGSGFLAQHSKTVHFGVGSAAGTVAATVRWPSGLSQQFPALPINQCVTIEEGSDQFKAVPFSPAPQHPPETAPAPDPLPTSVETWLLDPLKAPNFSLPNTTGETIQLQQFQGSPVLLHFWSIAAPSSLDQLKRLDQHHSASAGLKIIAIHVDPADADRARTAVRSIHLPVVFATEDTAGVYNIIYRYLFDRRRNLPLPSAFLLDKTGLIVKLYQGPLDPSRLAEDLRSIPTTPSERVAKALPFPGTLYQSSFSRNDFTYGVAMFQHGYLDQAADSFQQVVAAKPDNAEGFYNLGTLNLRRNDFPQARKYLEQTLKLKPDYPEAWNNLGMMAAQQGHPDEAIQNFQQSLKLRPGYAIALLNLGNVYRRQGVFDQASHALNQALQLQPDDPEINYSLGMFYAQQNQSDRAADYLQKAIALRPGYPEALNNLGVLYVRAQDYSRAEEQFQTCIRLTPAFDQSYLNLARLYVLQHDKEKAKQAISDLLRLQPQNANGLKAMDMLNAMP